MFYPAVWWSPALYFPACPWVCLPEAAVAGKRSSSSQLESTSRELLTCVWPATCAQPLTCVWPLRKPLGTPRRLNRSPLASVVTGTDVVVRRQGQIHLPCRITYDPPASERVAIEPLTPASLLGHAARPLPARDASEVHASSLTSWLASGAQPTLQRFGYTFHRLTYSTDAFAARVPANWLWLVCLLAFCMIGIYSVISPPWDSSASVARGNLPGAVRESSASDSPGSMDIDRSGSPTGPFNQDSPAISQASLGSQQSSDTHASHQPVMLPIGDIQLGQRVLGDNPEGTEHAADVDMATWRRIDFQMHKADGGRLRIELLRPLTWIAQRQLTIGSFIELDMPEFGASGTACCIDIAACPSIRSGAGEVVTGKFTHTAGLLIAIHVIGLDQPLRCTANHPFWSDSLQCFKPADQLQPGELLRCGDQQRAVSHILAADHRAPVVNLEIHRTHVYLVSPLGILVHNNCPMGGGPGSFSQVIESMSDRAAAFQTLVTGQATSVGYVVKGVKFDGFDDGAGILLDAKGPGYATFVRNGEFQPWFRGADDLVAQALASIGCGCWHTHPVAFRGTASRRCNSCALEGARYYRHRHRREALIEGSTVINVFWCILGLSARNHRTSAQRE